MLSYNLLWLPFYNCFIVFSNNMLFLGFLIEIIPRSYFKILPFNLPTSIEVVSLRVCSFSFPVFHLSNQISGVYYRASIIMIHRWNSMQIYIFVYNCHEIDTLQFSFYCAVRGKKKSAADIYADLGWTK